MRQAAINYGEHAKTAIRLGWTDQAYEYARAAVRCAAGASIPMQCSAGCEGVEWTKPGLPDALPCEHCGAALVVSPEF